MKKLFLALLAVSSILSSNLYSMEERTINEKEEEIIKEIDRFERYYERTHATNTLSKYLEDINALISAICDAQKNKNEFPNVANIDPETMKKLIDTRDDIEAGLLFHTSRIKKNNRK